MAGRTEIWWRQPWLWVEAFAIVNLGFLTFDIYLAHSVNQFRHWAEYIPLLFSLLSPLLLVIGLLQWKRRPKLWNLLGHFIGWCAVVIGCAGVILHLESHFFYERTIRSLTYSAPFAAPLAYAGLGLLLIMNRMVAHDTEEWAQWILFLTLGGFVGNFIFSLTDHAGNGFFFKVEWVPVIASAMAIGILAALLITDVSRGFLRLCWTILLLEAGVGVWGFILHAAANLRGPSVHAFNNFVYGAPPFAPLLFPNLVVLGLIGLSQILAVKFQPRMRPNV